MKIYKILIHASLSILASTQSYASEGAAASPSCQVGQARLIEGREILQNRLAALHATNQQLSAQLAAANQQIAELKRQVAIQNLPQLQSGSRYYSKKQIDAMLQEQQ